MVRHKNRYFVLEVKTSSLDNTARPLLLKQDALFRAITQQVETLHGDYGVASIKSGLICKYCNCITRIAIVRARRGPHTYIATSLPFIKKLDTTPVGIRTLYLGATMQNCFKFIKKFQEGKVREFCSKLSNDEDRKELAEAIRNLQPVTQFS